MVAGQEGNEPVYMAQLFLEPNCSLPTANPILLWFSDLLTSLGDKFNTLACTMYELDDWAAHTEIMCYHRINKDHREIKKQMAKLQAHLSLNNEALDRCQFHIEVSRVPHQL